MNIVNYFQKNYRFILYSALNRDILIQGTTIKQIDGINFAGDSFASNNFAIHTVETVDERDLVIKNRDMLVKELGFDGLITLKQTHSDIIIYVDKDNINNLLLNPLVEGDGLLTGLNNYLIGVLTADCVPIVFMPIDDSIPVFAAVVHAGWRGVYQKIHTQMIAKITEKYCVDSSEIAILIAPHIRQCCYEVSKDLIDKFGTDKYELREGRCFLNLQAIITDSLLEVGVKSENIYNSALCTKCSTEPEFYSYRNGDKIGRSLTFVGIKAKK